MMVPLSVVTTDLHLAAFPAMLSFFKASFFEIQLSQSAYLAGFALFTLLIPFLLKKISPKGVLLGALISYILGSFLAAFTSSISLFIAARLLQSLGGSSTSILSRIEVRQSVQSDQLPSVFAWMFFAISICFVTMPLLGAFLQHVLGWQANFLLLALMGVLYFYLACRLLSFEKMSEKEDFSFYKLLQVGPYCFYTLFTTLSWCSLMGFIAISPFLIRIYCNQSAFMFSVLYSFVLACFILGNRCGRLKMHYSFASILIGVVLLFFTLFSPLLFLFVLGSALLLFGTGCLLPQLQAAALLSLNQGVGYGLSLMYFSMMLSSCGCSVLVGQYGDRPFLAAQLLSVLGVSQCLLYVIQNALEKTQNISHKS